MKQTESQKPPITMGLADHAIEEDQAAELIRQGKLQEAEKIYRMLIAAGSKNCIVFGNLAAICGMHGKFDEVIELLKRVLKLNPNHPATHVNLGNVLKEQGDLNAAITSYNKAIELKTNLPEAHNNLGSVLRAQGKLNDSIASFNKAIELDTNYPEAHFNLGIALNEKGDMANSHLHLGISLNMQGDVNDAITSFNTALKLKPDFPKAHNNLALALQKLGNIDDAIASLNRALELEPNYTEAYKNLGNAMKERGDISAAIEAFKKALELKPHFPEARFKCATMLLLSGDYKNGWDGYKWRAKKDLPVVEAHALPKCAQWCGKQLSAGSNLLLVSEQGLGDTLQFMRYTRALQRQGITTSLCAQTKLHSLIQASGLDTSPLTPQQANKVSDGYWSPLLSVPQYLGIHPNNPIITEPYIKTTEALSKKWREILANEKQPIIGINWQGNPEPEKEGLRGRSLPLEAFSAVTNNIPIIFLSLQKGFGSEQLDTCSFKERFVSCQDQINQTWDFLETAAIIDNCDLIITSDTSMAHLAGGMGKTTWLLLHKVPDWRWGLEAETTFWYPTMRLFRQQASGDWGEVLEKVTEGLQKHFGNS